MYALPSMPDHDIPGHSSNDRHLPHGMRNLPYSTHFNDEQGRKGFADVDAIIRGGIRARRLPFAGILIHHDGVLGDPSRSVRRPRHRTLSVTAALLSLPPQETEQGRNATVNGIFYESDAVSVPRQLPRGWSISHSQALRVFYAYVVHATGGLPSSTDELNTGGSGDS
ncbi:hypothetical protein NUW54_g13977 [Trametes sanguinea]|uniref:Uncharacterized protein n=1 Tax=Trametes sanguinea TaxID=158606 RepID=A0ACC1MGQ1_9APHY|nr:hypothetical protein NUW54_g13977 [Trametes sanguinea]